MAKSDAVTAGEHFVRLLETDPKFRAGFEPTSAKLRAFGVACRLVGQATAAIDAELQPIVAAHQTEIDRLCAEYRDVAQRIESGWEAEYGEPYPRDVDDWYRWAWRAEFLPGERILAGDWTLHDLFPCIEGYLLKLRDQRDSTHTPTMRRRSDAGDDPPATDDDADQQMVRLAHAVGDDNAGRIIAMSQRADLTGEQKMIEILKLDKRFEGKKSSQWADLLRVSPDAVRGYETWKTLRKRDRTRD